MSVQGTERRRFITYCTDILLAMIGLLLAIPAIGYWFAPLWKRREESSAEAGFVDVGSIADVPAGQWRLLPLEVVHQDGWKKTKFRHSVWVRRTGSSDSEVTVLSSICPHLGCPINWHPEQSQFSCPCHGGTFNTSGQQTGGPPPRSMDPLNIEIRAGRLWVQWQDFKIGVAQRVPVNV
jgi:Rieske Fe-S protein